MTLLFQIQLLNFFMRKFLQISMIEFRITKSCYPIWITADSDPGLSRCTDYFIRYTPVLVWSLVCCWGGMYRIKFSVHPKVYLECIKKLFRCLSIFDTPYGSNLMDFVSVGFALESVRIVSIFMRVYFNILTQILIQIERM